MKKYFLMAFVIFTAMSSTITWAQSNIKVDYNTGSGTPMKQVEAVFRPASGDENGQALLILHHGGGYNDNTTQQYAEFFSNKGFATLELIMFRDIFSRNRPDPVSATSFL